MSTEHESSRFIEARELMRKYHALIERRDFISAMIMDAKLKIRAGGGSLIVEELKRKKSSLGHDSLIKDWDAIYNKSVDIWSNELDSIQSEIKALEELK